MLSLIVRAQTLAWRLKDRMTNEKGQTSSEYLVIAGLVVAAIIAIMLVFKTKLTTAVTQLGDKVVTQTK